MGDDMTVGRYVAVPVDMSPPGEIISGPFLLDPDANPDWSPGGGLVVVEESAALAAGWTYPPPPPPPALPGGQHVIVSTDPTDFAIYGRSDPGPDRRYVPEQDAYNLGYYDPS